MNQMDSLCEVALLQIEDSSMVDRFQLSSWRNFKCLTVNGWDSRLAASGWYRFIVGRLKSLTLEGFSHIKFLNGATSLRALTIGGTTPKELLTALERLRVIDYLDVELWIDSEYPPTMIDYPSRPMLPNLKILRLWADINIFWKPDALGSSAFLGSLLSGSQNLMVVQLQRPYYHYEQYTGDLAVARIVDLHRNRIRVLYLDGVQLSQECVEMICFQCIRLEALSIVLQWYLNLKTWRYNPQSMQPESTFTSESLDESRWSVVMEDMITTFRV
ncbi:hypothetical protein FRC17_002696 [Serendipita sp. 399]|nr:hypothetical protein FRC17_002696 [Serendipita sp. 399]